MSFTWEPLVKPPRPPSISGLSVDAEKILKAITKASTEDKKELEFDGDKNKFCISVTESFNLRNGEDFVSGYNIASLNDSVWKIKDAGFTHTKNRHMLASDVIEIGRNHSGKYTIETQFEKNVNIRNETNKNGISSSNFPGRVVSSETISTVRQLKEFQPFVADETPLLEECPRSNNISRMKSQRSFSRQRKTISRQLTIYDYFLPAKKIKS